MNERTTQAMKRQQPPYDIIERSWCEVSDVVTLQRFQELFRMTYDALCDALDRHGLSKSVGKTSPLGTFTAAGRSTCATVQARGISGVELEACLATFRKLGIRHGDEGAAFFAGFAEQAGWEESRDLFVAYLNGWRPALFDADGTVLMPEEQRDLRPAE